MSHTLLPCLHLLLNLSFDPLPIPQLRQLCGDALVASGCLLAGDAFGATVAENAVRHAAALSSSLNLMLLRSH
jgi:hypothetical protein